MLITMTPRFPTVDIKSKSLQNNIKANENFFEQLEKEVRQNPTKSKKLLTLISTTITMLTSQFISLPVHAATGVEIDPDLRMTILIIIGLVACLAIAAFFIAWMGAGVWKMFFGGSQADQWTQNIFKGLIQVLSAPVIITLVLWIFEKLFGSLPAFKIIEDAVKVWFQI